MKIQIDKPTFSPITITIESNSELLALLAAANVNGHARTNDLLSGMRDSITDNDKNIAGKVNCEFSNKIFEALVPHISGSVHVFNDTVVELIRKIQASLAYKQMSQKLPTENLVSFVMTSKHVIHQKMLCQNWKELKLNLKLDTEDTGPIDQQK